MTFLKSHTDNREIVIRLSNNELCDCVYMRMWFSPHVDDGLVLIDRKNLLNFWAANESTIGSSYGKGDKEQWKINLHSYGDLNYLSFTNGITRTLWLLSNDFPSIPCLVNEFEPRMLKMFNISRSWTFDTLPEMEYFN